ncbi:hypothetical protein [Dactylosporangium salmoneum]|uniref:DUF1883 domain-containing protein n=1 Tax=Dactylosporangium salmoneum TaxID=53361 RepID=A0ABN3G8Y8_9ACTN
MTFPAVLTAAGTCFVEADDLYVSWMGEDGDIVILGHHDEYRVRGSLQAFDEDTKNCPYDETWAVIVPSEDDAPWWLQWNVAADKPGAFPVTVVMA